MGAQYHHVLLPEPVDELEGMCDSSRITKKIKKINIFVSIIFI